MTSTAPRIGMKPPHPGRFVRDEILAPLGLSVAKAAAILRVRRATLSDLVNGRSAISADMALRIERAFDVNMETLLRLQAWHDAHAARERAGRLGVKRYVPSAA
jgi:antitoxin HigA-1